MSEVKHTPGPWKAHPTGHARSGKPEYEIHWSDDGECVAEIVHGEADAHLIAAAPDLLEALKALRLQALQSSVRDPSNEWGREALDKANSAVAKAEGRS